MDFSYSPRQQELKAAARSLYSVIEKYELDCEENNGLPPEAHRHVTEEVLAQRAAGDQHADRVGRRRAHRHRSR